MKTKNEKPCCYYCHKPLRPNYDLSCNLCGRSDHQHAIFPEQCPATYHSIRYGKNAKRILRGYGRFNRGMFCSDKHAVSFAEAAVRAGHRLD